MKIWSEWSLVCDDKLCKSNCRNKKSQPKRLATKYHFKNCIEVTDVQDWWLLFVTNCMLLNRKIKSLHFYWSPFSSSINSKQPSPYLSQQRANIFHPLKTLDCGGDGSCRRQDHNLRRRNN